VRFEVSEQSPYSFQMKKIYEFKDYLMDYLLMHYGLKKIAQKHYDYIVTRLSEFCVKQFQYSLQLAHCLATS